MDTVLLVMQGLQVVGTLLPSTLEAALKLKEILSADGSDFTAQVLTIQNGAVQTAQETLDVIAAWKKEHGFDD